MEGEIGGGEGGGGVAVAVGGGGEVRLGGKGKESEAVMLMLWTAARTASRYYCECECRFGCVEAEASTCGRGQAVDLDRRWAHCLRYHVVVLIWPVGTQIEEK